MKGDEQFELEIWEHSNLRLPNGVETRLIFCAAFTGDTTNSKGRSLRALLGTPGGLSFAANLIPFINQVPLLHCHLKCLQHMLL